MQDSPQKKKKNKKQCIDSCKIIPQSFMCSKCVAVSLSAETLPSACISYISGGTQSVCSRFDDLKIRLNNQLFFSLTAPLNCVFTNFNQQKVCVCNLIFFVVRLAAHMLMHVNLHVVMDVNMHTVHVDLSLSSLLVFSTWRPGKNYPRFTAKQSTIWLCNNRILAA